MVCTGESSYVVDSNDKIVSKFGWYFVLDNKGHNFSAEASDIIARELQESIQAIMR